jgi:putative DNA primase/helicase
MIGEELARALGGRRVGGCWMARCPSHADNIPSLSITVASDGKVLVKCHAGCRQQAVIAALRSRGLWSGIASAFQATSNEYAARGDHEQHRASGRQFALHVFRRAEYGSNTLVETYLRARLITIPVPQILRFRRALKHPSGSSWPAMVALVTRGSDGADLGIHRTFLANDGLEKAPITPNKMMLGPCRGGAVRLGPVGKVLLVGEGIETCLAAMQATGLPVWAALSTSGLRGLDLPPGARDILVLADGDQPGEAAAVAAAHRWRDEGRRVRIARPPRGLDFNDLLKKAAGDC